jgi:hydroxyacylglutathione hydrolase
VATDVHRLPIRGVFGVVNAYLLRGSGGCVLVDSGWSGTHAQLQKELEAAGCPPTDLKLLLITHADGDHTGSGAWLHRTLRVPIAMHAAEVPVTEQTGDPFQSRTTRVGPVARAVMKAFGVFIHTEPFGADVIVDEGFDLSPYGVDAKVVRLPGHSNGSIGVLTTEGDLVCGDLLMNMKTPARHFIVDDRAGSDAAVARLDTLGIRTVYPGHGAPFAWSEFVH